jgi:prephenate dehydrogenase
MATITIIGTGLIGCSLGVAFRKRGHFTIGCDNSISNLEQAKQIGAIDLIAPSITYAVQQSQVVVLATPVDVIVEILPQVLRNLPLNAVAIDTGSTKMKICQSVQNHPRRSSFVAAHPMAGSAQSGPSAAKGNLFVGKKVIVCERELSLESSIVKALEIFNQVGLDPIFLTPSQHDATAALVSHLPQLLTYAYAGLPEFSSGINQSWSEMASSGFESSTRLAASMPEVWLPILTQNKEFIVNALRSMAKTIDSLATNLLENNTMLLRAQMERARSTRAVYDGKQKELSEEVKLISLTE